MNKYILISVIIILLITIKKIISEYDKKFYKYDKKFLEYDMKIGNACSSMENFVVNLDDKNDGTAITNMLSLAKGDKVTLKSLVITGDVQIGGSLKVDGNSIIMGSNTITGNNTVNGSLTVKNGGNLDGNYIASGNFNIGGSSTINALTIKNGGTFGGNYNAGGDFNIAGNIDIKGSSTIGQTSTVNGKLTVKNGSDLSGINKLNDLTIKENRIQYNNYELNFNPDGWIRVLKANTTNNDDYAANGIAQKSIWVRDGGTLGGNYTVGGNFNINGDLNLGGSSTIGKNSQVNGTETVNGLFTVKNGSRFSGGRHYFNDEEKNDCWLRVGIAWGHPGIYADNNRPLNLGASNGNVFIYE